jgi:hypothetical protein
MHLDLPIDIFTFPDVPLPHVWTVEQIYDTPALTLEQVTVQSRNAVDALVQTRGLRAGATVAVGVGSRGLDNLVTIIAAAVGRLRALGMQPFIVPAMGSHGGATAEGQIELLHGYGIVPEVVGAEIRATMEVEQIGTLTGEDAGEFAGQPVYCDRNALTADAILLVNRIKAHTDFSGELESGIGKMSVIGLGKRHGAESVHRYGAHGLRDLIPRLARYNAVRLPLLGGIAVLENELGHTSELHALTPDQIGREGEKSLLQRARETAPRLPFDTLDILIVDEMGKNISGAGLDTHVIGRGTMPSIPEHTWGGPDIHIIGVLDLTAASHGNATAYGLADLVTRRLIEKTDFAASYINMRTSGEGGILRGRLPMIMPTSEDCVRTAYACCGKADPDLVRFARIRNTADTQYLEVSEALLAEARQNPRLRVSQGSHALDLCSAVRPM